MYSDVAKGTVWGVGIGDQMITSNLTYSIGVRVFETAVALDNRRISTNSENLLITMYENASFVGGTQMPVINRNRITPRENQRPVDVYRDVAAIVTPNNIIGRTAIKNGRRESKNDPFSQLDEFILEPNSTYIIQFYNDWTSDCEVDFTSVIREVEV